MPAARALSDVLSFVDVTSSGCHIWRGCVHKRGYGIVSFHGQHRAHRFFYQQLVGPIPYGLYVCHRCHVKLCVNPTHLYAGTQTQNMADMVAANRQAHGETIAEHKHGARNAAAKLTDLAVAEIRRLRVSGLRLKDIANCFDVSEATICRVVNFNAWRKNAAGRWVLREVEL